jgi:hypothetical protein
MNKLLSALCAALLCACATAQIPDSKPVGDDHPGSIPVLLGLDPVRQDLKLSSLQCSLLDAMRSEYKARSRKITQMGTAADDAALRAGWDLRSLRKQYNRRALAVLDSSQADRLRQIERQMLGGNLLTSPAEQKLLGLSQQQQQQLGSIARSSNSKAAAINAQASSGKLSPFWSDIKRHQLQGATSRQMLSVLTDKQRKQWLVLSGQKMGLPKIQDPSARTESLFEAY